MELNQTMYDLLDTNKALQEKAYQTIIEFCQSQGYEFGFSSSLCIDLDFGVVGVRSCNLKGIYVKNNEVFVEAIDVDSCEERDICLPVGQSIEIMEILADASFSEEETFLKKHPLDSSLKTDEEIEQAWKLLADVTINEDDEIDRDFLYWESGTDRQEIWRWFDDHHSKGVGYLSTIA